ncbi:hypothetical protein Lser_V15G09724 [Lactuca serriola]
MGNKWARMAIEGLKNNHSSAIFRVQFTQGVFEKIQK